MVAALTACAADGLMVHSMLTRDGRRMVSRLEGGKRVYSLEPTNQLSANLPPVREWKLYGIKSAHTDIGLTNPQYIQRHWTVRRIDEAARLIDADTRSDDDPAAYRFAMEHVWFWDNYHQDKGMDAAWRIVTNYMARRISTPRRRSTAPPSRSVCWSRSGASTRIRSSWPTTPASAAR